MWEALSSARPPCIRGSPRTEKHRSLAIAQFPIAGSDHGDACAARATRSRSGGTVNLLADDDANPRCLVTIVGNCEPLQVVCQNQRQFNRWVRVQCCDPTQCCDPSYRPKKSEIWWCWQALASQTARRKFPSRPGNTRERRPGTKHQLMDDGCGPPNWRCPTAGTAGGGATAASVTRPLTPIRCQHNPCSQRRQGSSQQRHQNRDQHDRLL